MLGAQARARSLDLPSAILILGRESNLFPTYDVAATASRRQARRLQLLTLSLEIMSANVDDQNRSIPYS